MKLNAKGVAGFLQPVNIFDFNVLRHYSQLSHNYSYRGLTAE